MGTLRLWVKSGDLEHVLVYRARAGHPTILTVSRADRLDWRLGHIFLHM